MSRNVADLLWEMLANAGVKRCYGIVGDALNPVIDGLRRNGQPALAEAIACRFMVSVQDVYRQSGKLVEKYDVVTTGRSGGGGEYTTQDGFGWTNGVIRKLLVLYPADAAYTSTEQCAAPPQ